jgi:hypothetical protein
VAQRWINLNIYDVFEAQKENEMKEQEEEGSNQNENEAEEGAGPSWVKRVPIATPRKRYICVVCGDAHFRLRRHLRHVYHYIGSAAIRTAKEAKEAKDVEEGEGEDENTILATKRDT